MGKDNTKNLVGQPLFKQIVKMLPRDHFDILVRQCGSDRYYKTFFSWDQLMVMLFGIFSRCDSMGEVCDVMRALEGKLNYLNMDCAPAKSTAGDALRERSEELFRLYYFALIAYFRPLLSVSRKKDVGFEEFYAFDSSTVTLFSDVMKGVGRNPKDDGKKKGGLKVHMLTDVHADTAVFATISEVKMHDKKFLSHLNPSKGSMPVFDKAYNFYCQFSDWTKEGGNFVCRLKDNAKSQLQEVLFEKKLKKEESGVYKIEHIHLDYKRGKKKETLCLRLVYYKDEKGRKYKFITNNWEITPEEVALIYKYRWTIELTFKKTETKLSTALLLLGNGKRDKDTGLVTLIAHLLLNVVRVLSGEQKGVFNHCSIGADTLD